VSAPLEHLEGKYEILEKLREGGMGAVYKVRHRLLEEVRVIKLIRHQYRHDDEVKARFVREARTVIRLRHPNIAQLYDFSLDAESNAYIVMEYVEGLTLEDLQRKIGVAPVAFTLAVAAQALGALGYLHRKGIVHRDISPDNLMVARDDDGQPLVKLIDLGVAKTLKGTTSFTQAGTFLGKVRYASPEQFRAQETESVDQRSDIYSFGVVLYEQLTGCHPIPAANMSALIAAHLFEPPLPFAETDPGGRVPDDLRGAVLRALAKPPAERFQDAAAFAAALAAVAGRFPLEPGFLDFPFASGDVPTERIEVARPGSTQDRLDREFQLRPTPAPVQTPPPDEAGRAPTRSLPGTPERQQAERASPAAAVPADAAAPATATTPVPARASRPHDRVTALVADARVMLEIGQTEQARARLEEALRLEPDNREVRRLLAGRAATPAPARSERADDDATERRVRAAVAVHLREARSAAEGGRHEEAIGELRRALELSPDDAMVRHVLAQTEAELDKRHAEETAARRLADTVQRVAALLATDHVDDAAAALAAAGAALRDRPEFEQLQRRVDERRQALERRHTTKERAARARRLARSGKFSEALELLAAARGEAGDDDAAVRLLEETEAALHRLGEERRQARQRADAESMIEDCLGRGDLAGAARALELAERVFPGETAFLALRHRVESGRRGEHGRRVAALLNEARAVAAAGNVERAVKLLDEDAAAGDHPDVLRLKDELRRRTAVAAIEASLARGRRAEARRALAVAEKLYPGEPIFEALRQRLAGDDDER
jgi:serine/threonine-protein kinase